jgi:hypothetical protein
MEDLPHDSDSEDEGDHEAPIQSCDVTCSVQVVEENEEQPTIPKVVYMSFKRKGGDVEVFGNFMKEIKVDLEKFFEVGYGEDQE